MRISPSWGHSALITLYEKKSDFFVENKKKEQLKLPESLSLEECLTETWKWQLQYSLKLLKANGNEDQLERMKSSTWLYVPSVLPQIVWLWPENKERSLQAPLCSIPLLQYGFF